jgi:hypothetical protein
MRRKLVLHNVSLYWKMKTLATQPFPTSAIPDPATFGPGYGQPSGYRSHFYSGLVWTLKQQIIKVITRLLPETVLCLVSLAPSIPWHPEAQPLQSPHA